MAGELWQEALLLQQWVEHNHYILALVQQYSLKMVWLECSRDCYYISLEHQLNNVRPVLFM